jgi:hypothetical protein
VTCRSSSVMNIMIRRWKLPPAASGRFANNA